MLVPVILQRGARARANVAPPGPDDPALVVVTFVRGARATLNFAVSSGGGGGGGGTGVVDGQKIYDLSHVIAADFGSRSLFFPTGIGHEAIKWGDVNGNLIFYLDPPASSGYVFYKSDRASYILNMYNTSADFYVPMTGSTIAPSTDFVPTIDLINRKVLANNGTTTELDWHDPTRLSFFSGTSYVGSDGKYHGDGSALTGVVGAVASVFGRTGAVVQVAGDYAAIAENLTNKNLAGAGNTFPTFNQNTTGSAAKLTTARNINGVLFDGSANIVTPVIGAAGTNLQSDGTNWNPQAANSIYNNSTRLASPIVSLLTAGAPADIGTITIPSYILRWAITNVACAIFIYTNTQTGTPAAGTLVLRSAASGGGTAFNTALAPSSGANTFVAAGALANGGTFTGNTIYINQTVNSANAATVTVYIQLIPIGF